MSTMKYRITFHTYWNTELVAAKFLFALHASHLKTYFKRLKYAYPAMQLDLQMAKTKQNKKRGIQFDIKTPPAPIHTISYKFILTTLQNLIKSRVHVYYIVYRITKAVRNIKHYVRFHFNITAKEGVRDYFG
jgi:hypothetical protein